MALAAVAVFVLLLPMTLGQNVVRIHQEDIHRFSNGGKERAGQFNFASYYNNHMVLQKAPQRAVVWGFYPDIGDRIIVKVKGLPKTYSADVTAGPSGEGVWSVSLDPINSPSAFTITAMADDGASISISDVLFGDVWVCSGQSNMQFTTYQIYNATDELSQASKYTHIRLFTVAMKYSATPLTDLSGIAENWALPNATTVGAGAFSYFSAVCWLYGRRLYEELQYPIGLIDTTWGGTPVEAWSSPDALAKCGLKAEHKASETDIQLKKYTPLEGPGDNSQLWNAMVNPLLKMTIYGAIWYQGEADSAEPKMHMYNCTFPAMIDDWRAKWSAQSKETSPTFPFGFVQLSGNRADMTITTGFPDIRWHQTADYGYVPNPRMQNVFMSVAMDLPDFTSPWGSIHPRDKQDVAQRLFLGGLYIAYNRPQKCNGPLPANFTQSGSYIILSYGSSWMLNVPNQEGFELCCTVNGQDACIRENSWWLPTSVQTWDSSTVSLDGSICGDGQYIAGIRYAWRESPCVFKQCAVYSTENELPAPPFISIKPKGASTDFTYSIDWGKPQIIPY